MAKVKMTKVPVSRRAVIQRIQRRIAADGLVLKAMHRRGPQRYFVLNQRTNEVEFIELEAYARQLRVLGDWEQVS